MGDKYKDNTSQSLSVLSDNIIGQARTIMGKDVEDTLRTLRLFSKPETSVELSFADRCGKTAYPLIEKRINEYINIFDRGIELSVIDIHHNTSTVSSSEDDFRTSINLLEECALDHATEIARMFKIANNKFSDISNANDSRTLFLDMHAMISCGLASYLECSLHEMLVEKDWRATLYNYGKGALNFIKCRRD